MSKKVIPDLDKVLAGTEFEDKLENYKKFFVQSKIVTVLDLENSPRYAGPRLCGHDTYAFIKHVRDFTLNPPPEPEPKLEPKPITGKKKTSKKVEPVASSNEKEMVTDSSESDAVDSDVLLEDARKSNDKEIK